MEKQLIHIHAKCKAFEIFEVVEEKNAVRRLKQIKALSKNKTAGNRFIPFAHPGNDKLVVNTVIINPTLFA